MHELSIAQSIVEMADEVAAKQGARVLAVNLKLGAMSSVVEEALQFSFEMVAAGTAVEGAALAVEHIPLVVFCPQCAAESTLSTPNLACPRCGELVTRVVRGKELEVVSVELTDD